MTQRLSTCETHLQECLLRGDVQYHNLVEATSSSPIVMLQWTPMAAVAQLPAEALLQDQAAGPAAAAAQHPAHPQLVRMSIGP